MRPKDQKERSLTIFQPITRRRTTEVTGAAHPVGGKLTGSLTHTRGHARKYDSVKQKRVTEIRWPRASGGSRPADFWGKRPSCYISTPSPFCLFSATTKKSNGTKNEPVARP